MEHDEKTGGPEPSIRDLSASSSPPPELPAGDLINASGHKQELKRHFSLVSLCAVAITTGNTWVAIGGSVVSFADATTLFTSDPATGNRYLQWRTSRCPLRIVSPPVPRTCGPILTEM